MFFSIDCLGPTIWSFSDAQGVQHQQQQRLHPITGWLGFHLVVCFGWRIHQTRCRISVGRHAYLHTAAWCSKHRKSRVRCGFCSWGAGKICYRQREGERDDWTRAQWWNYNMTSAKLLLSFLCMFFVDDMPYSSNTCLIQTPYQIVSIWSTLTPHFFNPRFITRHFGNGGFIKTSVQINLSNMFLSCSDYVFRVLWHQSHNFGT